MKHIGPTLDITSANARVLVLPRMVGGQIKRTGAAWNGYAVTQCGEPLVVQNVLTNLAHCRVQASKTTLELLQQLVQGFFRHRRVATQCGELLLVTLKVFENVRFQVGAATSFHQLKQGGQREVVVYRGVT